MSDKSIQAHRVTRPFQLLAAWLVALLVLVGSFLTSAKVISEPSWAPGVLVMSAVLAVPCFLACMFLLQTKFRAQMQEDQYYTEYLRSNLPIQAEILSRKLKAQLRDSGLGLESLSRGHTLDEVSLDKEQEISTLVADLRRLIPRLEVASESKSSESNVKASAIYAVGKALMAEGRWARAAVYFAQVTELDPSNWEAQFALGYCHGKSRLGMISDQAALAAYSRALELIPSNIDPNLRARLHIYHAAMSKRLGSLLEAEQELLIAKELAVEEEDIQDLKYHLSSIYAMTERHSDAIKLILELRDTPYLASIWSHIDDYFASMKDLPSFKSAIQDPHASLDNSKDSSRMLKFRSNR